MFAYANTNSHSHGYGYGDSYTDRNPDLHTRRWLVGGSEPPEYRGAPGWRLFPC